MLISDDKLVLAVLLKLYSFAEQDGDLLWVDRLRKMFGFDVPAWRLEIALESMRKTQWANPELIMGKVVWKITPGGYKIVQDCLRQTNTFLYRLNANGSDWLNSSEAASAKIGPSLKIAIASNPFDPDSIQNNGDALPPAVSRWELHKSENRLALVAIIVTIAGILVGAAVAIIPWWLT